MAGIKGQKWSGKRPKRKVKVNTALPPELEKALGIEAKKQKKSKSRLLMEIVNNWYEKLKQ